MGKPRPTGPTGTRWCPACTSFKPLSIFTKNRRRNRETDDLRGYCQPCDVAYQTANRRARGIPVQWRRPRASQGHRYCSRCKTIKPQVDFGDADFLRYPRRVCLTCAAAATAARNGGYVVGPTGRHRKIEGGEILCTRCRAKKPVADFSLRNTGSYQSWCRQCCREHKQARRDQVNLNQRLTAAARRWEVIEAYGGKCVCCGEGDRRFLSIDHIANDGAEHRQTVRAAQLYGWLKRNGFPKDNFQLLCFNCNMGKSVNRGVCPHQADREAATASDVPL